MGVLLLLLALSLRLRIIISHAVATTTVTSTPKQRVKSGRKRVCLSQSMIAAVLPFAFGVVLAQEDATKRSIGNCCLQVTKRRDPKRASDDHLACAFLFGGGRAAAAVAEYPIQVQPHPPYPSRFRFT
jgi:hypothetical protein